MPGGNYVRYFDEDDDNWYTVRVSDGAKTNITKGLGVTFQSETDDRPEHPTPYGQAGWTDGDKSILLYDRYDIWEVRPDASAPRMLILVEHHHVHGLYAAGERDAIQPAGLRAFVHRRHQQRSRR